MELEWKSEERELTWMDEEERDSQVVWDSFKKSY